LGCCEHTRFRRAAVMLFDGIACEFSTLRCHTSRCVTLNRKSAISPLPVALVRSAKEEVEPRNGFELPLGGHIAPARRAVSSGFRWVEFTLLVAVGPSTVRHNHVISRCFVRPGSAVCDHSVPCRHHQSRFARLIHAAKPARV
jgi:hypothetical protein